MNMPLSSLLDEARARLDNKQLLGADGSVSLRLPDTPTLLFLPANADTDSDSESTSIPFAQAQGGAALHAAIYRSRADVGAIALGGGPFGRALVDFDGDLPQVFDEQARQLGRTAPPLAQIGDDLPAQAARYLAAGGNVWVCARRVVLLGTTVQRMLLNAELLEKCAKAYTLAAATGARVHTLPWWVCRIANGRLKKDQHRARERFGQGLLPEESVGY